MKAWHDPDWSPEAWDCPVCGWRVVVRTLKDGTWRVWGHKFYVEGKGRRCAGPEHALDPAEVRRVMDEASRRPPPSLVEWAKRMDPEGKVPRLVELLGQFSG